MLTSIPCRRCTCVTPIVRHQGLCGHGGRDGDHRAGDDRAQRTGAVHRELLVARPAARWQRRPAQAGHHRARARTSSPRLRRRTTTGADSTCTAAPRCRARTWPVSAALLKELHPDWSPMAIKSALMTTGYDVLDGTRAANPIVIFRQGAGHVSPLKAADPGLVFDSRLQRLAGVPVRHRPAARWRVAAARLSYRSE